MAFTKFQRIILISVGLVLLITVLDIKGVNMFGLIGGLGGESYKAIETQYLQFFWSFAFAIIFILAISWYIYTKDKSETVALIAIPTILLQGGWEDISYYILGGYKFFGTTMPWLYENCFFMRWVAQIMGKTTVDSTSLIVSAGLSAIIAYYVYKYLEKSKW